MILSDNNTVVSPPRRGRPRRPKVTDDTRQAARDLFRELARLFPDDDLYQFEERMRPVADALWAVTTYHFAFPQRGPGWLDSQREPTEAEKQRLADKQRLMDAERRALRRMMIGGGK